MQPPIDAPAPKAQAADDGATLLTNGGGAAAILAAGFGSLAIGVFNYLDDMVPVIHTAFIIWRPSGSLSGLSTSAIMVWVVSWAVLSALWSGRSVNLARVNAVALAMLAVGLLLTFPPLIDLLEGK